MKGFDLVNLANSLLAHAGSATHHASIPEVDALLAKHDKVMVVLLDGLGSFVQESNARESAPLLNHKFMEIRSIHPATTVAATTSFLTGKYPIETGWLGWSLYLEEANRNINVFPGTDSATGKRYSEQRIMYRIAPIETIDEQMAKAGAKAELLFPDEVRPTGYRSVREAYRRADRFFEEGGKFFYLYFNEPDHYLHHYGIKAREVKRYIAFAAERIERFAKEHPDVLMLVIADHGHMPVINRDVACYPTITGLLRHPISIDARTISFAVKPGLEKRFESEFEKHLGKHFALHKAQDLLDSHYFGEGEINPLAPSILGDYVAIAKDDSVLYDSRLEHHKHKAHHSGESEAEMRINLAVWNA